MPKLRNLHKILDSEIRRKNLRELGYLIKGMYWDFLQPPIPDPIFVVGCSRSGTTVTYETIASSPELLSFGYEIPSFWNNLWGPHHNGWASEAASEADANSEHRARALRYFYQRLGAGTVLEKTCINVMRLPYLYSLFPQSKFVFIHRDGRDNISSMIDGWRHDGHFGLTRFLGPSPDPVSIDNGRFHEWSFFTPSRTNTNGHLHYTNEA